ncbi:MAG: hypothetical protein P0Y53_03065 [Candidatus Pseudobacter hemicellulosilyticus]|uniref:Uncharacterized protein n=1 Tax=Candidatus Pseudobacter hemicellulosilyticus TaxID=3121375 RepID=A0AAJ6BI34_9BACT|nr:MAG: hypothetical protein P0Y53_03065 [Pseudobacter sp.]
MDKINVLWIEDNPIQESLKLKDLIDSDPALQKLFPEELWGEFIPAIQFEGEAAGYEQYFNLQVLQHPIECKDFISACLQLEDRMGITAFNKLKGVLPEVIAFDYHFGEKIMVNQGRGAMSYHPRSRSLRQFINPNYRFLENKEIRSVMEDLLPFQLEQREAQNYTEIDFLMDISRVKSPANVREKDEKALVEDDFGLLTAIEVLRLFRAHTVVAMPATFVRDQIENLSLHGKFFEWLNEYDWSIDFNRAGRGKKKWDLTLKDAMIALQKKIANHLSLGKLFVSYSQLNELTKENLPQERVLAYRNAYGTKKLPLDGLFFYIPANDRDAAIREWATSLCKAYADSAGQVSFTLYQDAVEESGKLVNAFTAKLVDKRIELSKQVVRYLNKKIPLEDKQLSGLMDHFGVTQHHINAFRAGRAANYHCITRHIVDIRKVNREIARLVVLMTDIRLHTIYQQFMEATAASGFDNRTMKLLKGRPSYDDLLYVLYPVAENPLVLPYHLVFLEGVFSDDVMKTRLRQPFEVWETLINNIGLRENSVYPAGLTQGERRLCASFAEETGLGINYYPSWLQ